MDDLKRKKATISDVAELLAGWSDSEFATAASGEYCEDLKSMIEGAIARALDPTPPADTAGLVERLCMNCRHYRDLFCQNPDAPYGGKIRLPVQCCHAFKGY